MRSALTRITSTPAAANAYAVAHPVRPPPTMATRVSLLPRYRGRPRSRDAGSASIQRDFPYFVTSDGILLRGRANSSGHTGHTGQDLGKTGLHIVDACERIGRDPHALVYASRTAAKVDSAAVQDGFQLYREST